MDKTMQLCSSRYYLDSQSWISKKRETEEQLTNTATAVSTAKQERSGGAIKKEEFVTLHSNVNIYFTSFT